jgi:hypothetical protein
MVMSAVQPIFLAGSRPVSIPSEFGHYFLSHLQHSQRTDHPKELAADRGYHFFGRETAVRQTEDEGGLKAFPLSLAVIETGFFGL